MPGDDDGDGGSIAAKFATGRHRGLEIDLRLTTIKLTALAAAAASRRSLVATYS